MNTIELDGQVFDLVPRTTIIEEQQQTFTPPHDINSEIPAQPDYSELQTGTINADDVQTVEDCSDVNNILDDFKACLQAQNEVGIDEYGVPLKDSKLTILELSNYEFEEVIDTLQYNRVVNQRMHKVIELLEQVKNIPQVNEALIMLRGEEDETN